MCGEAPPRVGGRVELAAEMPLGREAIDVEPWAWASEGSGGAAAERCVAWAGSMLRVDDDADDESLLVRDEATAPICRAAEGAASWEERAGSEDGGVADLEPDDWLFPMVGGGLTREGDVT